MATELTVVEAPDAYEDVITVTPVDPGFVAADAVNGNSFRCTGKELIWVRNTDGAAPHNVTVTSQPASRTGRLGDITAAVIPLSGERVFQILPVDGWEVGGLCFISADDAQIEFAIIRYPLQVAN